MTDREKVQHGLECCYNNNCGACPYSAIIKCQHKLHSDALALLKEQEERWIPVTERLPEPVSAQTRRKTKPVKLYSPKGGFYVGWYFGKDYRGHVFANRTSKDSLQYITTKVTHWMPLHEPPKGEDNG